MRKELSFLLGGLEKIWFIIVFFNNLLSFKYEKKILLKKLLN